MINEVKRNRLFLGKIYSNVDKQITDDIRIYPKPSYPHIFCKWSDIWELETTSLSLSAPRFDRPILKEYYYLQPYDKLSDENKPNYWISKLNSILGLPLNVKIEDWCNSSDCIAYFSEWKANDIVVSLSIYGGIRKINDRSEAGVISFRFSDETMIAKEFVEKIRKDEEKYWGNETKPNFFREHKVSNKIKPYFQPTYVHPKIETTYDDISHRVSQKALYTVDLYETPFFIKEKLDEFSVAFWNLGKDNNFYISTKWDTVIINDKSISNLQFFNVLNEYGSEIYSSLHLNSLSINDSYNSGHLIKLIDDIENMLGIKIDKKIVRNQR
jgi:hypothetical protein